MAKIKPTLTITANADGASTNKGPLSIALSLSATAAATANGGYLGVDNVESKIHTVATSSTQSERLLDGSTMIGTGAAGTDGCFLFIRNMQTSGSEEIYLAILNEQSPDNGVGPDLDTDDDQERQMTLLAGEFAFFPWDYCGDIFVQASAASQKLEYWRFDRGAL